MVRSKAPKKKQHGVDFKKIKKKIGRKLPPPKNATNTEIKSRAIIIPEQSVASEKVGLAVGKKGLTLKELLQQTSHHNAKFRRAALLDIRDLLLNHPVELRMHKYAIMEKLRERISDDDKMVRETLYKLLDNVIIPGCKEDDPGPLISLMMVYIFNAMTHLVIDVRLMALEFFVLLLQHYPSFFSLYAEKILQNYKDILCNNHLYMHEKGKLKKVLSGLIHCLSLLPENEVGSDKKNNAAYEVLHAFDVEVPRHCFGYYDMLKKQRDLIPVLINCFQEFVPLLRGAPVIDAQSFHCMLYILQAIYFLVRFSTNMYEKLQPESQTYLPKNEVPDTTINDLLLSRKLFSFFPLNPVHNLSGKGGERYLIMNIMVTKIFVLLSQWICPPAALLERFLELMENVLSGELLGDIWNGNSICVQHISSLLPSIPKVVLQVETKWKSRLIKAFTKLFRDCNEKSSLKLACLSTIEEMLIPGHGMLLTDSNDPDLLSHVKTWIGELTKLLVTLGDKHPMHTQAVLHLQLRLGQRGLLISSLAEEYDRMQYSPCGFYITFRNESTNEVQYGPFITLPRNSQELAINCLYYFFPLDTNLLESLAFVSLCPFLEPSVLMRILEVLHSSFKAGHIQTADYISFLVTLVSRFRASPDAAETSTTSNELFRKREVLKSITNLVLSSLSQIGDPCLIFQVTEKVLLLELSVMPALDNMCFLLRLLVRLDAKPSKLSRESIISLSSILPKYLIDVANCIQEDDESKLHAQIHYLLPCFFLFDRSEELLNLVLKEMASSLSGHLSNPVQFATEFSDKIYATVSVLLFMHSDPKVRLILSSCHAAVGQILDSAFQMQSLKEVNMSIEARHKIQCAVDRLKIINSSPNEFH